MAFFSSEGRKQVARAPIFFSAAPLNTTVLIVRVAPEKQAALQQSLTATILSQAGSPPSTALYDKWSQLLQIDLSNAQLAAISPLDIQRAVDQAGGTTLYGGARVVGVPPTTAEEFEAREQRQRLLKQQQEEAAERQRIELERQARVVQRQEQERQEGERLEKQEQERQERERLQKEQQERQERERLQKEQQEKQERERERTQKQEAERQERERLQKEQQEKQEIERLRKQEEERQQIERLQKEEQERQEQARLRKGEQERLEREKRQKEEQERERQQRAREERVAKRQQEKQQREKQAQIKKEEEEQKRERQQRAEAEREAAVEKGKPPALPPRVLPAIPPVVPKPVPKACDVENARSVPQREFFHLTVGMPEAEFNQTILSDPSYLQSVMTEASVLLPKCFETGNLRSIRVGDLRQTTLETRRGPGTFNVIEGSGLGPGSETFSNVDMASLQANPENANAVFQLSVRFNGLDVPSEKNTLALSVDPGAAQVFADPTTGETLYPLWLESVYPATTSESGWAAISASPGLIRRRYYAFQEENPTNPATWPQTQQRFINMASDLKEWLTVRDSGWGYLTPQAVQATTSIPSENAVVDKSRILVHRNVRVAFGKRIQLKQRNDIRFLGNQDQPLIVHQVLTAAIDFRALQNAPWVNNATAMEVARQLVHAAYLGTILDAMKSGAVKLFVTMVGLGYHDRQFEWIISSLESLSPLISRSGLRVTLVWTDSRTTATPDVARSVRGRLLDLVRKSPGGRYVQWISGQTAATVLTGPLTVEEIRLRQARTGLEETMLQAERAEAAKQWQGKPCEPIDVPRRDDPTKFDTIPRTRCPLDTPRASVCVDATRVAELCAKTGIRDPTIATERASQAAFERSRQLVLLSTQQKRLQDEIAALVGTQDPQAPEKRQLLLQQLANIEQKLLPLRIRELERQFHADVLAEEPKKESLALSRLQRGLEKIQDYERALTALRNRIDVPSLQQAERLKLQLNFEKQLIPTYNGLLDEYRRLSTTPQQ